MKKVKGTINPKREISKINKEIYGHFSEHLGRCIYGGIFVGEDSEIPNTKGMRNDVVAALKEMQIPVLRWPGGCFADEYHWKDGIGPLADRKRMINTHWGGVLEDNSFGTHEFFELCDQLGCEPYINGNLGSGSVREMSEWIEYMTFDGESPMSKLREANGRKEPWKLKYFGVGNENWGCGGNMTPEYYGNEYRRYQTYCRNYGDNKLYKIACGPNGDDYDWTDKLMNLIKDQQADAISLHYYTVTHDWDHKGSATEFTEEEYYETISKTLYIEPMIERHLAVMDKHDPEHKVKLVVDEWGTWHDVEEGTNPGFLYQQNTMRDAIVAALNLNIFNRHSDRISMANIAQVVNVLQAVILTEGAKILKTPTYHVFEMFKGHQEAKLVDCYFDVEKKECKGKEIPVISSSASVNDKGEMTITLANPLLTEDVEVNADILGDYCDVTGKILIADVGAYNTFENPDKVAPKEYDGFKLEYGTLSGNIPPCSVVTLVLN
ncbi:alpha-N-arabinofuranosidase [Eubacterium xylanophilum]|uniref:alpha-N-arabinofuranosidase n=1 Tax=Eubacterium xylanophilum TaxID=39497 RepID=UPI0004BA91B2|nr:alpha-L-arabinofuranosidase C-terminal domain-containing protein [Eubacterium xylanophilum]